MDLRRKTNQILTNKKNYGWSNIVANIVVEIDPATLNKLLYISVGNLSGSDCFINSPIHY